MGGAHFTGCGYSYYQSQVHESDGGIIKLFCVCARGTEGNATTFTGTGAQHFPKLSDQSTWRNEI